MQRLVLESFDDRRLVVGRSGKAPRRGDPLAKSSIGEDPSLGSSIYQGAHFNADTVLPKGGFNYEEVFTDQLIERAKVYRFSG